MESEQTLNLILDIHKMAGNIDARVERLEKRQEKLEYIILGNGKPGFLGRLERVESTARGWAKRHAIQLRVAGVAGAAMTGIGGVLGFITAHSKAIAAVLE